MSVLLPECLVRVIADVHRVTFEEVRQRTLNAEEGDQVVAGWS